MSDQTGQCAPVIVALPAQIDLTSAERAYDDLYAAFASGASIVIADFTATAFCDCSSLRRLLDVQDRAAARHGQLRFAIPTEGQVRRLAELTDLDRRLPVYASRAEAVSASRPPATADIIDVIAADNVHIMRWQARLSQPGTGRGDPGSAPETAAWDTVASLIDLHTRAEDEVCGPAICGSGPDGRVLILEIKDAHQEIREIIGEASLRPPGSPSWWWLVTTALDAWTEQLHREAHGPLAGYLRRADPALRRRLTLQWRAFTEAHIRDRYPQAPSEVPTCRLRQARPAAPRLADPAFAPLSCTCQACTQRLNEAVRPAGRALYDRVLHGRPDGDEHQRAAPAPQAVPADPAG